MSFKYYVIIWGGGHQMITSDYGGEGGSGQPKYDYVIFECSLDITIQLYKVFNEVQ